MALNIRLEDERGNCVDETVDDSYIIQKNWDAIVKNMTRCLCFIDWYGDTIFNTLQMDAFLDELKKLSEIVRNKTEQDELFFKKLKYLADKCKNGVHLYLKFYGD